MEPVDDRILCYALYINSISDLLVHDAHHYVYGGQLNIINCLILYIESICNILYRAMDDTLSIHIRVYGSLTVLLLLSIIFYL